VQTTGEVLITFGLVVLLFVFYEVYVTNWLSAGKQHDATSALDNRWKDDPPTVDEPNGRTAKPRVAEGQGFAKFYVPSFGSDFTFTVVEGTNEADLAIGPGHYTGTPLPGEPGNFSVAGHRVGKGAPFNDLDLLQSCDAIVVETQADWFVYRVLPFAGEVAGWAAGKGSRPQCAGVKPLGGLYDRTTGQQIVRPTQGDVIGTVPNRPGAQPAPGQEASLITLTTCHPKFSAAQRLIVHGVLTGQYPKDPHNPGARPPEMGG
jgi:sortase (surface protein transpeptidase)